MEKNKLVNFKNRKGIKVVFKILLFCFLFNSLLSGCGIYFTKIPYKIITSGVILPHNYIKELSLDFIDTIQIKSQSGIYESKILLIESKNEPLTTIISISNPIDTVNSPLLSVITKPNCTTHIYVVERRKHVMGRLYYIIKNEASIYISDKTSYKYKKDYASIWIDKNRRIINNFRNGYSEVAVIGLDKNGYIYIKYNGRKSFLNKGKTQKLNHSIYL